MFLQGSTNGNPTTPSPFFRAEQKPYYLLGIKTSIFSWFYDPMGQPTLPVLSTHKTYLGDGLNN